jgi:hypothetical protein
MPYPALPGPRIAYHDRRVAEVFVHQSAEYGGGWPALHPDASRALNGDVGEFAACSFPSGDVYGSSNPQPEVWTPGNSSGGTLAVMFQVPMRIDGIFCFHRAILGSQFTSAVTNRPISLFSSRDSTSGGDGNWRFEGDYLSLIRATNTASWVDGGTERDDELSSQTVMRWDGTTSFRYGWYPPRKKYRSNVIPLSIPSLTALQLRVGLEGLSTRSVRDSMISLHLYGRPLLSPDRRLDFWHPTQPQVLEPEGLGWGDQNVGNTAVRAFRIRNASSTDTALDVVVRPDEGPFYTLGGLGPLMQISADGGLTWQDSITLASLPPLGVSPVLQIRLSLLAATNYRLGPRSPVIRAEEGSWA